MSDYQAQTVTECLSTWCTLTAGHNGDHTDLREPRTAREDLARIIRDGVGVWRTPLEAADAILKAGYGKLADAFPIIRDLADPDDCWFDHHGGCQAHGYLSLQPGETCPQHDAKEWLKANEGNAP